MCASKQTLQLQVNIPSNNSLKVIEVYHPNTPWCISPHQGTFIIIKLIYFIWEHLGLASFSPQGHSSVSWSMLYKNAILEGVFHKEKVHGKQWFSLYCYKERCSLWDFMFYFRDSARLDLETFHSYLWNWYLLRKLLMNVYCE